MSIFTLTLWITTRNLWLTAQAQADDTRAAVVVAKESAKAANIAALAASNQVEVARKTLADSNAAVAAINRPYVTVTRFLATPVKDFKTENVFCWNITVFIDNVGNTPASGANKTEESRLICTTSECRVGRLT